MKRLKALIYELMDANKERQKDDSPEAREKVRKISEEIEIHSRELVRELSNEAIAKLTEIATASRELRTRHKDLKGKDVTYIIQAIQADEIFFRKEVDHIKKAA